MNRYLLDANIFITPANDYYPFAECPGFWEWLNADRALCSIQEVQTELLGHDDELAQWIRDGHGPEFLAQTAETQKEMADIAAFVCGRDEFSQAVKNKFLGGADPWLIAMSRCTGWPIVTKETYVPGCKSKIKLPMVAEEFGVRCMTLPELMSTRRVRLVLEWEAPEES